jgi:predicted kinase
MVTLNCKIMRGCSGSGKSTYVKNNFPKATVLSTDDFWLDAEGKYNFDPKKAGEAHAWNLRRFVDFVKYWYEVQEDEVDDCKADVTVVVDNTNTTVAELAPYAAVAGAFGFNVEIITIDVTTDIAHPRNVHSVPQPVVHGQRRNLVANNGYIPKWWKHKIVTQES